MLDRCHGCLSDIDNLTEDQDRRAGKYRRSVDLEEMISSL